MMRYVMLNSLFLILPAFLYWRATVIMRKSMLKTLALLLIMTLVFDNLIVGLGIVSYDPRYISGIKLLYAPIEDFAYTIWAAIVLPFIYERISRHESIT